MCPSFLKMQFQGIVSPSKQLPSFRVLPCPISPRSRPVGLRPSLADEYVGDGGMGLGKDFQIRLGRVIDITIIQHHSQLRNPSRSQQIIIAIPGYLWDNSQDQYQYRSQRCLGALAEETQSALIMCTLAALPETNLGKRHDGPTCLQWSPHSSPSFMMGLPRGSYTLWLFVA